MLYDEVEAGGIGAKMFRYQFVQNDLQGLQGANVPPNCRAQVIDAMVCQIQHMKRQLASVSQRFRYEPCCSPRRRTASGTARSTGAWTSSWSI